MRVAELFPIVNESAEPFLNRSTPTALRRLGPRRRADDPACAALDVSERYSLLISYRDVTE